LLPNKRNLASFCCVFRGVNASLGKVGLLKSRNISNVSAVDFLYDDKSFYSVGKLESQFEWSHILPYSGSTFYHIIHIKDNDRSRYPTCQLVNPDAAYFSTTA